MPATDIPWVQASVGDWDTLYLGPPGKAEAFPGLATVKIKGGLDLQKNKAKGRKGGSIKVEGLKPADLDITLRIWTEDQNDELNRLFPLLEPTDDYKDGKAEPLEIGHPACVNRQVSQVIITDLDGPNISRGPWREYAIKAIQYLPEEDKPVGGTVGASAGAVQAGIDDLQRQKARFIAQLAAETFVVPHTSEREATLQEYRQKIDGIDTLLNEAQAKQGGGKLPPTAPKPADKGVVTGHV